MASQSIQYKRYGQDQNYHQMVNYEKHYNKHYENRLVSIYQGLSHRGESY